VNFDYGEIYERNAEYYDLVTDGRIETLRPAIEAVLADAPVDRYPVVDVGAGTGRLTVAIADLAPTARVFALEPTRVMRALLRARLADRADLRPRVTVIPATLSAGAARLPERLGAVLAFGSLPHFSPDDRRELFAFLADRLAPGGGALVEVMSPRSSTPVPTTRFAAVPLGEHVVEGWMAAEPAGPAAMTWTMTYRLLHGDELLDEQVGRNTVWTYDPDELRAEAKAAGLHADPIANLPGTTVGEGLMLLRPAGNA
jgi:SAM-dependent methyltransferase